MEELVKKIMKLILGSIIWMLLGINRFIIMTASFQQIADRLGCEMNEAEVVYTRRSIQRSKTLGRIIRKMSRYTPWESKCFVQALTAMELMKVLRIPGTVYFGIMREEEGLKAHAWVKHGELFVTGQNGHDRFQPVAYYGSN